MTGALGQTLRDNPLITDRVVVQFDYRKFAERTEEYRTGADGALMVTITPPNGPSDAQGRLVSSQAMQESDDAIGIFYTPDNIYVVDAEALNELTVDELRQPLSGPHRLITLETYFGKWLPRCARGDNRPEFLERADTGQGFMHLITMDVRSRIPLLPQAKEDIPRQNLGRQSRAEKARRRRR